MAASSPAASWPPAGVGPCPLQTTVRVNQLEGTRHYKLVVAMERFIPGLRFAVDVRTASRCVRSYLKEGATGGRRAGSQARWPGGAPARAWRAGAIGGRNRRLESSRCELTAATLPAALPPPFSLAGECGGRAHRPPHSHPGLDPRASLPAPPRLGPISSRGAAGHFSGLCGGCIYGAGAGSIRRP
eukprot:scaffold17806_cov90-Isochrysis_galbana.AAC.1